MLLNILTWGLAVGVLHFAVVGGLYQNPLVAKLYHAAEEHPGVKPWPDKKKYVLSMFLGTQLEVFILTAGYLWLRQLQLGATSAERVFALGGIFAALRVYPRFWNMWIQSTYPGPLLAVELVNGTLGTFLIVAGVEWLAAR